MNKYTKRDRYHLLKGFSLIPYTHWGIAKFMTPLTYKVNKAAHTLQGEARKVAIRLTAQLLRKKK